MNLRDRRLLVLVLYVPALVFLVAHYTGEQRDADEIGTGFVQYDQAYYMANARQYVDGATDGILYASPFSAKAHPPPIYFQPQVFVLGWIWRLTGMDPGTLFCLFGVLFGLLCIGSCLRLLDHALPTMMKDRSLLGLLLIWGGGLFFVLGLGYGLLLGEGPALAFWGAFRFDPASGWWFLNLGRNIIYPFESYYHFLFFSIVLAILNKHYTKVALLAGLLAISHPFTGVATLLMLCAWSMGERWILRMRDLPRWFAPTLLATFLLTLVYYGIVLPRDAEHAALMAQWKIAWTEDLITAVAAYAIVGSLAIARLLSFIRIKDLLRDPFQRLLWIWAITWLALENHELFISPVQPLHFTHGYTWCALFLIGAPFLARTVEKARRSFGRPVFALMTSAAATFFLLDNGVWMATRIRENPNSITITRDQRALYAWLDDAIPPNTLLVCDDPMLAYLALVYTPHRAYCSHRYNTPFAEERRASTIDYFNGRSTDPLLMQDLVVVANEEERPFVFADRSKRLFSSGALVVYQMPAPP